MWGVIWEQQYPKLYIEEKGIWNDQDGDVCKGVLIAGENCFVGSRIAKSDNMLKASSYETKY